MRRAHTILDLIAHLNELYGQYGNIPLSLSGDGVNHYPITVHELPEHGAVSLGPDVSVDQLKDRLVR